MLKRLFSIATALFLCLAVQPALADPPSDKEIDDKIPIERYEPFGFYAEGAPGADFGNIVQPAIIYGVTLSVSARPNSKCFVRAELELKENGVVTGQKKQLAHVVSAAGADASSGNSVNVIFPKPIDLKYKFEAGVYEYNFSRVITNASTGTCSLSGVLYKQDY
jgi:hypothetical protein